MKRAIDVPGSAELDAAMKFELIASLPRHATMAMASYGDTDAIYWLCRMYDVRYTLCVDEDGVLVEPNGFHDTAAKTRWLEHLDLNFLLRMVAYGDGDAIAEFERRWLQLKRSDQSI